MLKNERLYIKIANELIDSINKGLYDVGSSLPPERKLSDQFNVSRTVIREAMVYLEMHGIVNIRKGAGVFVLKTPSEIEVDSSLPDATPFEILQARLFIEPQLARFAAENSTAELIETLENCIKMMESSMHFSEESLRKQASIDADKQFHYAINHALTNPLINHYSSTLMSFHMKGEMWQRMDQLADEPASKGKWIEDHKAIFLAIKEGNGEEAQQRMQNHINKVIDELTQDS